MTIKKKITVKAARPSKGQLAAIGEVITNWAYLQHTMDACICSMLDIAPNKSLWLTAPMKYHYRIDILRSVGHYYFTHNKKLQKEFSTILHEITERYTERNNIDHSIFMTIDFFKPGRGTVFKYKKQSKSSKNEVSLTSTREIRKIAKRIREVEDKLEDFLKSNVVSEQEP